MFLHNLFADVSDQNDMVVPMASMQSDPAKPEICAGLCQKGVFKNIGIGAETHGNFYAVFEVEYAGHQCQIALRPGNDAEIVKLAREYLSDINNHDRPNAREVEACITRFQGEWKKAMADLASWENYWQKRESSATPDTGTQELDYKHAHA